MPASLAHKTMDRYLRILQLIPRKRGVTSVQNMLDALERQGVTVSKRTLQRDLEFLSSVLPINHSEESQGNAFWWFWAPDAKSITFPSPSLEAAISILLVEKHLESIIPSDLLGTMRTVVPQLDSLMRNERDNLRFKQMEKKVAFSPNRFELVPPKMNEEVHTLVYRAVEEEKQIRIWYRNFDAEIAKPIDLSPLAIVYKPPTTYLIGTAFKYKDPRHYSLNRVEKVEVKSESVVPPKGFSLQEYMLTAQLSFRRGDKIELILWVDKMFARYFSEIKISANQTMQVRADGHSILTASLYFSQDLINWLLGFSEWIEVLGPTEAREEFGRILRRSAKRYVKGSK